MRSPPTVAPWNMPIHLQRATVMTSAHAILKNIFRSPQMTFSCFSEREQNRRTELNASDFYGKR
ncbi:hypothetical protein AOLI_G00179750 [Acnodon oligacanthus]